MSTRLVALLAALALGCAAAGRPPASGAAPASPAAPPALLAAVGQPPAPGSDEARADLAIVLWLQRTRSAADVARAASEVELSLDTFAGALGARLAPDDRPATRTLLEHVLARAAPAVREVKKAFARPRPFAQDPRVEPAVEREPTFSFPSGHATRGVLMARVLAELAPARREPLREAGLRIGYDRVLGGVHFPTDVLAGQRLGDALADLILAAPEVRAELRAVRAAEWAGGATPPRPRRVQAATPASP